MKKKLLLFLPFCLSATLIIKAQAPANDNCANALTLTVGSSCVLVDATTVNATNQVASVAGYPSPACAGSVYNEVWFKFIAPSGGSVIIDSDENVMTDGGMALYSGSCGSLTLIDCDDDGSSNGGGYMSKIASSGLTPGQTYFIAFWSFGGTDDGSFKICASTPPPPPANDECAGALSVIVNSDLLCTSQTAGTIESATPSAEGIGTCSGTANDDVWFSFTATATSHNIKLNNVVGSTTDLYHAVYGGACGNLGTALICSDPNTSSLTGLVIGNTYYIRVYSWGSTPGQDTDFNVCITTLPPTPTNDNCANATPFPTILSDGTCSNLLNQSTASATNSQVTPTGSCTSNSGTPQDDVWFSFVAPAAAVQLNATYVDGSTDVYWQVFSGACASSMTSILCTDTDSGGTLTNLTTSSTYYIRLYTWGTTTYSTQNICLKTPPPAPVNDDCSNAITLTPSEFTTCATPYNGTIESATQSTQANGCTGTADDDVWFKFTATQTSHTITLSNVSGSTTDLYHSIYSGDCTTPGTALVCSDPNSSTVSNLTVGNIYYVRVYSWTNTPGQTSVFDICIGNPNSTAPALSQGTINSSTSCASPNGSVQLTGTGTGTISWTGTSSGSNPNITLPTVVQNLAAGTYTFTFNNGANSNPITVTIQGPQGPTVSLASYSAICNTSASFTLNQGSPANGTYTVNGASATFFNPATSIIGSNTIIYSFTDANSCTATASQTIIVNDCSSITETANSIFEIFPNPANELINIIGEKASLISEWKIVDATGREVLSAKNLGETKTISTSKLANGSYHLILIGKSFEETKKIQILK